MLKREKSYTMPNNIPIVTDWNQCIKAIHSKYLSKLGLKALSSHLYDSNCYESHGCSIQNILFSLLVDLHHQPFIHDTGCFK